MVRDPEMLTDFLGYLGHRIANAQTPADEIEIREEVINLLRASGDESLDTLAQRVLRKTFAQVVEEQS